VPDPNNPMEVVLRELQRIIGFDYKTTDMALVRESLIKFADARAVEQRKEIEMDEPW